MNGGRNHMPSGNSITRKITETEYKYKIITAGSKLGMPIGSPVKVGYGYWGEQEYFVAKTHSKTAGRIDGLAQFYKDTGLKVGDEVSISYDDSLNKVLISQSAPAGRDDDLPAVAPPSVFQDMPAGGNDGLLPDLLIPSFDLGDNSFTEQSINAWPVEAKRLGIVDSDSWKNLPFHSYMPPASPVDYSAASNDRYVALITSREYKLYVFDRNTKTCRRVTWELDKRSAKEFTWTVGACQILNNFLYWTDGRRVFKTSLTDGATDTIYKLDKYKGENNQISEIYDGSDHFGTAGAYCINTRYSEKTGSTRTILINLADWSVGAEMGKIPAKYGEIIGTGPKGVLLADSRSHASEMYTYSFYNFNSNDPAVPIFEYAFEDPAFDAMRRNTDAKTLFGGNVFAVDLYTHTVVVRDYPELRLTGYREGSLIKIGKDKMWRLNNIYRGKSCPELGARICEVYRDCQGHELTVNGGYRLAYRNPDGSVTELVDTWGSCVPEQFAVTDNHTAVIKIGEGKVAIVDFAENMRYTFDF